MIWTILICLFSTKYVYGQFNEGDPCSTDDNTLGVCLQLENCPVIYEALLAGKMLGSACGYVSYEPIVCCPMKNDKPNRKTQETTTTTTTTTQRVSLTNRPLVSDDEGTTIGEINSRGAFAREKCEEYASSVYVEVIPPILAGNPKPVNISQCAIKSQKLIVGGTKASPKEFPHMAAVGFDSKNEGIRWMCGGTLVSELFVLTAAHCTHSIDHGAAAWIRLGDLILNDDNDDAKVQIRRIVKRIRHSDYKRPLQYHDIALVKMNKPVIFDAYVRPACLPTWKAMDDTKAAIATGWGDVEWEPDTRGSNHLLKVTLPLISQQQCNVHYGGVDYQLNRGIIDDWQICAGDRGKDTCQGDSGGPLVSYDDDYDCMYTIIGVTSLGKLCDSGVPGVYTRVYHYLTWLEDTIWSR